MNILHLKQRKEWCAPPPPLMVCSLCFCKLKKWVILLIVLISCVTKNNVVKEEGHGRDVSSTTAATTTNDAQSYSVLLQTHRHFASPMLKLKPLANVLSLPLLQSNRILSLLTSIIFSPPMPSKLHQRLTSTNKTTTDFKFCLLSFLTSLTSFSRPRRIPLSALPHILCVCVCVCVHVCGV